MAEPVAEVANGKENGSESVKLTEDNSAKAPQETSSIAETGTDKPDTDDVETGTKRKATESEHEDGGKRRHSRREDGRDKRHRGRDDGTRDRDWRDRRDSDRRDKHRNDKNNRGRGGARGRGNRFNKGYSLNKFTTKDMKETDDPTLIRQQVEFYFSDSNLLTDKFLLQQTGGPANKPVPVKVIHDFKRMKRYQPFSAVVEALKSSDKLDINDQDEITRKVPLTADATLDPEENRAIFDKATMNRSIYAKGFGDEKPSTQFDIEAFFAPYGPINAVRLRRHHDDNLFKGSVFVEFADDQTAEKFLALVADSQPEWEGKKLKIMGKTAYVDLRSEENNGKNKGSDDKEGSKDAEAFNILGNNGDEAAETEENTTVEKETGGDDEAENEE